LKSYFFFKVKLNKLKPAANTSYSKTKKNRITLSM